MSGRVKDVAEYAVAAIAPGAMVAFVIVSLGGGWLCGMHVLHWLARLLGEP